MDQLATQQQTPPGSPQEEFRPGLEDVVILPLVAVAFIVKVVLRALLTILIDIIDWLFPILLQVMRFPLFTIRIAGDGIAAVLKAVARLLPIGAVRQQAWRDFVSRNWAWLRQKFSYRVFEEWLHHVFEDGMAWVFRTCRTLTPRSALLVIVGAVLWIPISFGAATLMHALLLAWATSLPAWMQLLHPVATVIAKTKLLVLPVYPAAWPQAKQHPIVQAMIAAWRHLTTLHVIRKTGHRYRQTEGVAAEAAQAAGHAASAVGVSHLLRRQAAAVDATAAAVGLGLRTLALGTVAALATFPLFGDIVRRYQERYDQVGRQPSAPLSVRMSDYFARWSIKFSADYYEAREREAAAQGQTRAPVPPGGHI
jgi:hypothetical protein